jgi:nicotinate-nucleotide adenylyltransferase
MKVALFGGVFNPPHLGHVLIAQQVLDFAGVGELWFIPNYGQHPPKAGVASVEDRLAMVRLLEIPKTRVSTLEIDNKLDGNTINLLPHLPKEHEYVFLIGSDQLPSFESWGNWKELLKSMRFLVFPRLGHPASPLHENMSVLEHELLITTDISSTKIRERVKAHLFIDQFVPNEVASYIADRGLYKQ